MRKAMLARKPRSAIKAISPPMVVPLSPVMVVQGSVTNITKPLIA